MSCELTLLLYPSINLPLYPNRTRRFLDLLQEENERMRQSVGCVFPVSNGWRDASWYLGRRRCAVEKNWAEVREAMVSVVPSFVSEVGKKKKKREGKVLSLLACQSIKNACKLAVQIYSAGP